jgi:uncharacterized protein YcfL
MRLTLFLASFLLVGCAAQLPPLLTQGDPSQPFSQHTRQTNYFAGVTAFKPVPAGDWRTLNRRVAPEGEQK